MMFSTRLLMTAAPKRGVAAMISVPGAAARRAEAAQASVMATVMFAFETSIRIRLSPS